MGAPKNWCVADKTGTNFYDAAMGDIAVIWPPKAAPIVLVIYYKKNDKFAVKHEAIFASSARIALQAL